MATFAMLGQPTFASDDWNYQNDVLVLDDTNFDKAIEDFDFILIEFYAPWCEPCTKLMPQYEETATKLRTENEPSVFAKIDGTLYEELADRMEITQYPTFLFYAYGNRIDYEAGNYEGGRTTMAFEKFVKRKSMPASIEVDDCEELEHRTGLNELNLVYFGDY